MPSTAKHRPKLLVGLGHDQAAWLGNGCMYGGQRTPRTNPMGSRTLVARSPVAFHALFCRPGMRVTLSGRDHDGGCFERDSRASGYSWPGPRGTGRR